MKCNCRLGSLYALKALIDFQENQMSWDFFREDFSIPTDTASGNNAMAMKNYLEQHKAKYPEVWERLKEL